MKWEKIGDLTIKIDTWNPKAKISNDFFDYIDLSSIDKENKKLDLNLIQKIKGSDAPSRAKQLIQIKDVIVSTVRPNLNGVAMIDDEFQNATASTGYCILRTNSSLDSRYLYYWLLTPIFIEDMVRKATGANYPAVSDKTIKESKIPLPSLPEQKRIAAILDEADRLRQKDKQLIEKYNQLSQSVFLDMFGDPVTNPKGWEVKQLKDITTKIGSGNTPKGGSENYTKEGILFFRSQNVWRNRLVFDDIAHIDNETHNRMLGSSLKNGDILMTKTGRFNTENSSLGRAAMFLGKDDTANVNGHVYLIRLKKDIINKFVLFILTTNSYRNHIRSVCVGGIDKRQLNKNHLEDFPIISPPVDLQNKFATIITKIEQQKSQAEQNLAKSEDLFNSLLQRAFKGEL